MTPGGHHVGRTKDLVVIIIPVYNEEHSLTRATMQLIQFLKK